MVEINDLMIGDVYFFLVFIDSNLKIPKIRTLIYIGKNLENNNDSTTRNQWYFQDAESYMEYGNGLDVEGFEGYILTFEENMLDDVHDLSDLIKNWVRLIR